MQQKMSRDKRLSQQLTVFLFARARGSQGPRRGRRGEWLCVSKCWPGPLEKPPGPSPSVGLSSGWTPGALTAVPGELESRVVVLDLTLLSAESTGSLHMGHMCLPCQLGHLAGPPPPRRPYLVSLFI